MNRYTLLALFATAVLAACAGPKALPTVEYRCTDRSEVRVTYLDERALVLMGDGYSVDLPQRPAASGFQYVDARHELRGKGQEISFSRAGRPTLYCTATAS